MIQGEIFCIFILNRIFYKSTNFANEQIDGLFVASYFSCHLILKKYKHPLPGKWWNSKRNSAIPCAVGYSFLDRIMTYIVKRKGKQMRPMFVFLSAGVSGTISESTYRGAALIEFLHTATLVHDDVVVDASYRRGFFSMNALWKNNRRSGWGLFAFAWSPAVHRAWRP